MLLRRYNKQFTLDGWSIILNLKRFYVNRIYIHQNKGTVMATSFAIISTAIPQNSLDYLIRNYFFSFKWLFAEMLRKFDVRSFQNMASNVEWDWKVTFEGLCKYLNSLDANILILDNNLGMTSTLGWTVCL